MSDLAPIVAAAIRDQVVLDLQEENKALRKENKVLKDEAKFCVLFIAGPGYAAPPYARGYLREAKVFTQTEETQKKRVVIENFPDVPCPKTLQELEQTELWVGGRVLGTLPSAYNQAVDLIEENQEHYLRFRFMWLEQPPVSIETSVKVGPFESEEEARAEHRRCNFAPMGEILSGLSRVPGVEFQEVHLEEPLPELLE